MSQEPKIESDGAQAGRPDDAPAVARAAVERAAVEREPERSLFTPPIDIYESAEGLVLTADLPGVTVKSLDVQVQDNRLTIFGRVEPFAPANAKLLHQEFELGDFLRSFILSEEVDHDHISAKLNHGVLEVVLPKAPKASPRKIQVNQE